MIDLRNCKPEDKLISRGGKELTYVNFIEEEPIYPHMVSGRERLGSRCHDGKFWADGSETDEDVVQIVSQ